MMNILLELNTQQSNDEHFADIVYLNDAVRILITLDTINDLIST